MSRIWAADQIGDIASVGIGAMLGTAEGGFRSLYSTPVGARTSTMRAANAAPEDQGNPIEAAHIEGFTMGFDEGCRVTQEAVAADNAATNRLSEALELLTPAPSGMLSTMLSATVVRLVEQIVGEVEIDIERLLQRCDTVAAFIESDDGKGALYLHPDDVALVEGHDVGVKLVTDAAMARGCVRLETADGWVEDGPDVRLSRLRAMLDDMEGRP